MNYYTLKILDIIKETDDAVTLKFKQPGLKKIKYKPGQYITLIVNVNGRKYRRPYSLSSAPLSDSTLDVTVKRVPHGIVSNYLNDVLNIGDMLQVVEPMGDFTLPETEPLDEKTIYLWAAGSGITPQMSILKAGLTSSKAKMVLVYCNKNRKGAIFLDQLNALKETYPGRLIIHEFYTAETEQPPGLYLHGGRIEEDKVKLLLQSVELTGTLHYICGPGEMKRKIVQTLLLAGVSDLQIYTEDFDHVVSVDAIADVYTQTVEYKFNNETSRIEVVKGKSILEAGLDRNLDLPYSCQNGSCKLCKGKLLSGEVKQICEDTIDRISSGEFLLCCSYPLTKDVILNVEN